MTWVRKWIFILSFGARYTLLQVFSKFGKVTKLDYLFHKTGLLKGKPRGYAFIEYGNKDVSFRSFSCPSSVGFLVSFERPLAHARFFFFHCMLASSPTLAASVTMNVCAVATASRPLIRQRSEGAICLHAFFEPRSQL